MPSFRGTGRAEFLAVSWLAFVAAGAVLPTVSVVGHWGRRRSRNQPAFPLASADARSTQFARHGADPAVECASACAGAATFTDKRHLSLQHDAAGARSPTAALAAPSRPG